MKIYGIKILDINNERLNDLSLTVSTDVKLKIKRFVNKEDKIRALISDMLIKILISNNLKLKIKDIVVSKNKFGKPYLKNYKNFNFNISHSGEFVVCCIDAKPVGIDIEEIKQIEYKDIAEKFFVNREYKIIRACNKNQQLAKFYEFWTLKESYVKYCGEGLSIPLNSFLIDIRAADNIELVNNRERNICVLDLINIDRDYKLAICSKNKIDSKKVNSIRQNSLINMYLNLE